MFDCVIASTLPTVIVTMANTSNSNAQSVTSAGNPCPKIRNSMANDAAFEPTDRNAVIGVGAPSYTSGAHMWNGAAAILNPRPATISTTASSRRGSCACRANTGAIASRCVVPDTP